MSDPQTFTSGLLDASGQPVRARPDRRCPRCAAGPERRVASAGFGVAHPVCTRCGHEFVGEPWTPDEKGAA